MWYHDIRAHFNYYCERASYPFSNCLYITEWIKSWLAHRVPRLNESTPGCVLVYMQPCCVTNRRYWCPLSCTGRQSALLADNPVYWSPFTSMGAQTSVWFDIWLYWRSPLRTGCHSLLLVPNPPYWTPLGSIGVQPSVLVCFALLALNLPYWSPVNSTGVQPSICND